MSKLIIVNRTGMSMAKVLTYITAVIDQGRISNKRTQYCYATSFHDGTIVYSMMNDKSDRLLVTDP